MSAQPQPRLTPEQYLELDRASQFRNEYYNGRMWRLGEPPSVLAGGTYRHSKLTHSLSRRLGNALEGRPCEVTGGDIRVCAAPDGATTNPDIVVVRGEPKFADEHFDKLLNPTLVIEVLLPSTEAYDRGFKSAQYRQIESLEEYALVSQTEPRVEVFRRRQGVGHWLLSEFVGIEAVCEFESVSASVPLAEIYDKVVFDEGVEPLHPADK